MVIKVSDREFHTIAASLQYYKEMTREDSRIHDEIASDFGEIVPLNDDEIDRLCDRMSVSNDEAQS